MKFNSEQQQDFLQALLQEMPFGKYQGRKLMDLPGHYLAWFNRQGFPDNKLGRQMALVFELDTMVYWLVSEIKSINNQL